MVYMGSKRKYCKYIVPIIQEYIDKNNITTFVDCFCGGANLADKIKCDNIICNDLSPTLIALHQQAQKDFSEIPIDGDREYWDLAYNEWKKIKKQKDANKKHTSLLPLWIIGAIEWYASFSNGGFPRGYAKPSCDRNYYKEAYCNHKKQASSDIYKKINFSCGSYDEIKFPLNGVLLYCDSPYKNTKPYGISPKFNFSNYYEWLNKISKKYPVFVSEQNLPAEFNKFIVWKMDDAKRTNGLNNNFQACEKLYLIDNRKNT